VSYLCGDDGDNPDLAALGVDVAALGEAQLLARGRLAALRKGIWNAPAAALLADWIARNDTPGTVYHVHGWAQILSPSILAALAPVARRTILHAHDFFLACPNGAYMEYPVGAVCRRVPMSAGCIACHCDKRSRAQKAWRVMRHWRVSRDVPRGDWAAVAMIHPAMAEPLRRGGLPQERLAVLRNPAAATVPHRVRAEDNRGIVYVGRLIEAKGTVDLARAAARLDLPVTFVGEGAAVDAIRQACPHAEVVGWQDRAGMARYMGRARALAMPSRVPEPFGLVAAEAALSGLPVILPRMALISEDIVSAGLGLAYDARRPDALAEALAEVHRMPDTAVAEMSNRGVDGASGLAQTEDAWADGLLALYARALTASA
jgi:glycosyltransferase involved in cell wall biosynthesis